MAKVDIIMPAFNAARFLQVALQSVLAQTFSDWRILLVDDGSVDGTLDIAKQFAESLGPKMLVIRQENLGCAAARNTALRHATAEFLALLDADDVWLPHRLEESIAAFEGRPNIGLTYGGISFLSQEGKITGTPELPEQSIAGTVTRGIYTRAITFPCPTITFRRRCVEEVGNFDEALRASEDRDLWLRIALRYDVARVPGVMALYRSASGSMSTDYNRMLVAQRMFIDKHYGSPGCDASARRAALSNTHRELAETLSLRGRTRQAITNSLKSIALQPANALNWKYFAGILKRSVTAQQQ